MKFGTVREYFSKLYTMGFQLMMLPLVLFIIYSAQWIIKMPELVKFDQGPFPYYVLPEYIGSYCRSVRNKEESEWNSQGSWIRN